MFYLLQDIELMNRALDLAREGLGRVAPNPAVGCVVLDTAGAVVGEGRTADGGRPHAEVVALGMAGEAARGGTVYVSLEPCAHHGKTPPCAQALIDAGVARVVVACHDVDPRVSGRGIKMLRDAGIEVAQGVCEAEALALNAGFFLRVTQNRPFVTLKIAVSADNKIAEKPGVRTQITGVEASAYMHHLRSRHDAILVGMGTALADDPLLTARVDGLEHTITRVVLGDRKCLSQDSQLVKSADQHPLIIFDRHCEEQCDEAIHGLPQSLTLLRNDGIENVLNQLAERGITRLMVEGGAKVMHSFIEAGYGDELHIMRAPYVIGESGLAIDLDDAPAKLGLELAEKRAVGEDVLEIYRAKA